MTMMKRRNIIMVMMASLLLGSCSSDDILSVPNGNGRIRFDVGVSQSQEVAVTPMNGGATRSAEPLFLPTSSIEMHSGDMKMYANCASTADIPMHNIIPETTTRGSIQTEDHFYSNFGIFGYFYDSNLSWASNSSSISPESSSSMKNLKVTRDDNSWTTDVYWPGGTKRATFFAYAPYDCQGAILESNTGAPKITYTVPSEIAEQKDLLVAKSTEDISCDGKSTVALNFQHALTAIKFTQGELGDYTKIKSITISGVKNQGELSLDGASWDNVSTTSGNSYTISSPAGITLNDVLLLLMPQELPSGAKLLVRMSNNDGTNTKDFSADLTGVWQKGYTVTYQLSVNKIFGDYVLEITPNTKVINENGGDVSMTVRSYFEYSDGSSKISLPWTASYAYADGTDTRTPIDKALTITSASNGSGSTTGETLTANIAKQYLKSQYNFNVDENLKTKAQNSASPFDLSTYNPATGEIGTGRRSANCYIIKAPGYYKLPLVFGNTLNNLTNANGNDSPTFKDANNAPITSESISGVNGAKLLWQDEYGLIEPSSIRVADNYLYFEIKEGSITQGNALIAATSGENGTGDILWSWHIWVTDADFQSTVLIHGGASLKYSTGNTSGKKEFNFMKMPLGFCNSTTLKYPERKIVATIIQTGTSYKKTSVIITQTGSSSAEKSYGENCTFYQWGRKDPFPGSDGIKTIASNSISTPKYCYDADGNSFEYKKVGGDTSSGRTSKGGSIKNPYTFFYSLVTDTDTGPANDWCNETTYNNWSSNDNGVDFVDRTVVKSLYDPCPIGFKVPETTSFTGFTKTGDNFWSNSSNYNVNPETYDEGWSFCTTGWRTGATDFWRAFGIIDCWSERYEAGTGRGFLGWSGLVGYYWSARAYSAGYGRSLGFDSGGVNPQNYNYRAYGFSVRPVSE